MNKTVLSAFAILSLWSCLSTQPLIAAPASAQAASTKPKGTAHSIDINDLFQHWVHSSEEQQSGGTVQIFRPAASMKFPPSRFRMAYKFTASGDCEYYFLSPDDAHHFKACTWKLGTNDGALLQIVANGMTTSYRVAELSGKILRLTPLEPQRSK